MKPKGIDYITDQLADMVSRARPPRTIELELTLAQARHLVHLLRANQYTGDVAENAGFTPDQV